MMCSPLKGDIRFIFLKSHLENDSESPLILFYFFKRENKIRNKNPSVTLFVKKKVYEKLCQNSEVVLPFGNVQ